MNAVTQFQQSPLLVERFAGRYGVDPDKMMVTLKATCFKGNVSNEQMMALLVVAEQHGLNPWLKEIYAFPSQNGIVPVVGVDGWARIINAHPQFNGMDFEEAEDGAWIKCTIHRKDRAHPTSVTEWFSECGRDTAPWKSHPRRMLRHKALIQCARIAFSFAGIYDPDEAEAIMDAEINVTPRAPDPRGDLSLVDYSLRDKHVGALTDVLAEYGSDAAQAATKFREYIEAERLDEFQELWITVHDKLAADGIITKANMKKYRAAPAAALVADRGSTHTS